MKTVYAFIFARGGSKGLPRKNILPLGGIPLIAHSIKAAKAVPEISLTFVSTDDAEIKEVATTFGANVIDRPLDLAGDHASEWDAWRHAINTVESKGDAFDTFISLPATSPLRSTDDIRACLKMLDEETDAVITVTPASRNPYFNMVSRQLNGTTKILLKSSGFTRRQDTPEVFDITTVAYVLRKDFILKNNGIFAGNTRSVIIPKERAVDIDDYWDLKLAETIFNERKTDAFTR